MEKEEGSLVEKVKSDDNGWLLPSFRRAFTDVDSRLKTGELKKILLLADQKKIEYQVAIGWSMVVGEGVEKDVKTGEFYLKAASDNDCATAWYFYGVSLMLRKELRMAAKYLSKAANAGIAPAQLSLASMYSAGEGVKKDIVLAYMWLELARRGGIKVARERQAELRKQMNERDVRISIALVDEGSNTCSPQMSWTC
jgi:TPR repeat protein